MGTGWALAGLLVERAAARSAAAGAGAGSAAARRITRNGTSTVGAGSPGARGGGAAAAELQRGGASAWAGSRRSACGQASDGDQASRASDRTRRRSGGAPPWRRARPEAEALITAPPAAARAIQAPIGRAGLRQISRRSAMAGRGLMAATTRAARRGANSGSSRRRRSTAAQGAVGPCQRRREPRLSSRESNTRITRKSTISARLRGW